MNKMLFASAVLAIASSAATAVPLLGFQETWSSPPSLEGWQLDNSVWGAGGPLVTAANSAGFVEIQWADDPGPRAALFYADVNGSAGAFNGDTTGVETWTMRFQAVDTQAGSLAVFFANPGAARVWSYSLAPSPVSSGLVQYQFSAGAFGPGGWTMIQGGLGEDTLANFNLDRSTLNWIGVYVSDNGSFSGQERYRLDNFGTAIPEPEAVSLLLIAALSLGVTFRSRLAGLFGRVRSMVA